jgi:uncharacterized protein HemX
VSIALLVVLYIGTAVAGWWQHRRICERLRDELRVAKREAWENRMRSLACEMQALSAGWLICRMEQREARRALKRAQVGQ